MKRLLTSVVASLCVCSATISAQVRELPSPAGTGSGYQVRRAWPWLFCAVLVVFVFLFVRENFVADALYDDFFVNSSFLIAGATVFGCPA